MNTINLSPQLESLTKPELQKNPIEQTTNSFGKIIQETINSTAEAERAGEDAMANLASGQARNLHEVMISVEKADISLKMLVQFRNKALQAYEEIMRMQV